MTIDLPTDIDTAYPNNPGDASVELHQQYHDELHQRAKGVILARHHRGSRLMEVPDADQRR